MAVTASLNLARYLSNPLSLLSLYFSSSLYWRICFTYRVSLMSSVSSDFFFFSNNTYTHSKKVSLLWGPTSLTLINPIISTGLVKLRSPPPPHLCWVGAGLDSRKGGIERKWDTEILDVTMILTWLFESHLLKLCFHKLWGNNVYIICLTAVGRGTGLWQRQKHQPSKHVSCRSAHDVPSWN